MAVGYLAVSVKVTVAPPKANWSCAVTVMVPLVEGSLRVTEATPEELVVAMTLVPVVAPKVRVPAEVVKRIPAPVAEPRGLAGGEGDREGLGQGGSGSGRPGHCREEAVRVAAELAYDDPAALGLGGGAVAAGDGVMAEARRCCLRPR